MQNLGTAGRAKMLIATCRRIGVIELVNVAVVDIVATADATVCAPPLSCGVGFYNFKNALRAERQILPPNGSFDPQGIFDLAFHFVPYHLFVAPTMVKRMTWAKVSGLICELYIIAVMVLFGPIFILI